MESRTVRPANRTPFRPTTALVAALALLFSIGLASVHAHAADTADVEDYAAVPTNGCALCVLTHVPAETAAEPATVAIDGPVADASRFSDPEIRPATSVRLDPSRGPPTRF